MPSARRRARPSAMKTLTSWSTHREAMNERAERVDRSDRQVEVAGNHEDCHAHVRRRRTEPRSREWTLRTRLSGTRERETRIPPPITSPAMSAPSSLIAKRRASNEPEPSGLRSQPGRAVKRPAQRHSGRCREAAHRYERARFPMVAFSPRVRNRRPAGNVGILLGDEERARVDVRRRHAVLRLHVEVHHREVALGIGLLDQREGGDPLLDAVENGGETS